MTVLEQTERRPASVSQLSLAASCGEAYRRRYVDGEKPPSGLPAEAGSAVHQAVEVWERAHLDEGYVTLPANAGEEILALAQANLRAVPDLRTLRVYGKQNTNWWLKTGLKQRVDNYVTHHAAEVEAGWKWWTGVEDPFELDFLVESDGHEFRAVVDQVLLDSRGRIVVRDLKCGREKPWHSTQLEMYIVALRRQFDVDTDDLYGQILYLNGSKPKPRVVVPCLEQAHVDRMVTDLGQMVGSGIFPVTGPFTESCEFCDYRDGCPWGQIGRSNTFNTKGK